MASRSTAEGREIDPELRQAGALHHVLVNKEPLVRDRALLPGTTTTKFPGVVIYPELSGTNIWAELTHGLRPRVSTHTASRRKTLTS